MESFKQLRTTWWPSMHALIGQVVQDSGLPRESLMYRMMDYHLSTGGKRLRAILPLLIAEAMAVEPARLVPFGAACEMLHNAALVHDDLQDEDTLRRGRPAVWTKFGAAQAINLGDAMLCSALLLVQRLVCSSALREKIVARVLLGALRAIGGQSRELEFKTRPRVRLKEYLRMVEGKTSGLFALPVTGAALLCGASERVDRSLGEAARHIGALFQIQDDILDVYGNKGRRRRGNDLREGKQSVLVVHCLDAADAQRRAWLRGILAKPRDQTTDEDVACVTALFEDCGSLTFAFDELQRRRAAALAVPELATHPALLKVLDEICQASLEPIASVVSSVVARKHILPVKPCSRRPAKSVLTAV